MRRAVALFLGVVVSISACEHSTAVPNPNAIDVSGRWNGTESDRLGPALLSWTLTQRGALISGSARIRPVNATDGSCASCHKSKNGIVYGMVTGSTMQIAMYFAEGGVDDPTPACSIRLNVASATVSANTIAGAYSGSDPCEGVFDGTLSMTRGPEALQYTR